MGQFLKVAHEVLEREHRPLSAIEISQKAIAAGLLHTTGKTPWQTIKSKLSTDILQRGEHSLFMRTGKGRFGLRAWKPSLAEHIADRYQKALYDEDIVVIPADNLRSLIPGPGLFTGEFDRAQLYEQYRVMCRRDAEDDFDVIQLVSVFIVKHAGQYLTYKRSKRLPESRLHGYYSLAFGGHLNPDDFVPLLDIFDPEVGNPLLLRELHEELRIHTPDVQISYRGLLYDDSRSVSRQHLGLTYDVLLGSDAFEIGERGFLVDAKFETLAAIEERLEAFENWSVLLFKEELKLCGQTVAPS